MNPGQASSFLFVQETLNKVAAMRRRNTAEVTSHTNGPTTRRGWRIMDRERDADRETVGASGHEMPFGLIGVREHALMLGDSMRIDTAQSADFAIAVRFPLAMDATGRDHPMIKVLLADDHTLVRDGLRHILQQASGFEVAGEACDSATTIALIRATQAHVLVLDLSMPGRNGIELIKQIKEEKPGLRILVLTMHAEQQYAVRAFKAGASGYLTKESASAELVGAVTKVASGGVYVSLAMAERFAQNLNEPADALPHQRLSDREFDVFRRLVEGQSITEIANELCVSVKTISTHKTRILEKMQMPNENGLVRYAIRHKLFDDGNDL